MEKFTVCRDDTVYQAWPDVTLAQDGVLYCVFTECTHHADRAHSRLALVTSKDRGRTWSQRRYLTEPTTSEWYWNCARIVTRQDGTLMIVCDLVSGDTIGTVYYWLGDKNGQNWEGPIQTPASGIVPDRPLELESGRILLSCHYKHPETGMLCQRLWYSDDSMHTWLGPVMVANDNRYQLCEGSIVDLGQDVLVCLLRENSWIGLDGFKAISLDAGETWQGVYKMPLPACHRPVGGVLQNGKILITYRFMQGGKGWLGAWTQNLFAVLTDRDSLLEKERSKQAMRIFPVDYDRSPVSDLGYSGWVQFADGEIYIVNYIVDDAPKPYIRGYSLWEKDMLL